MRKYGIGYKGSKSTIAEYIINALPSGKRLVDLFGGGFAISHCALLSRKYEQVLYNDVNPLLPKLIQDAINGKYSYERFIPEWISREKFFELKDKDGYIKWCWSFGCDGETYIFGKDIEHIKHYGHEWVFYDTPIPGYEDLKCNIPCDAEHYSQRRKFLSRFAKQNKSERSELQQLERLERLQQLERTARTARTNVYGLP